MPPIVKPTLNERPGICHSIPNTPPRLRCNHARPCTPLRRGSSFFRFCQCHQKPRRFSSRRTARCLISSKTAFISSLISLPCFLHRHDPLRFRLACLRVVASETLISGCTFGWFASHLHVLSQLFPVGLR